MLTLLAAAAAMAAFGLAGRTPPDLWHSLFASPKDGSWTAITFDGEAVSPNQYLITIRRGKIVGGHDDCNGWSYQDEGPDSKGERMIVSTAQECPENRLDRLYWVLVHAPQVNLLRDGQLQLSRAGHAGLFRRCEPDRQLGRCVPH